MFRFVFQKIKNTVTMDHITIIAGDHFIKHDHTTAFFFGFCHSGIELTGINFSRFGFFFIGKIPGKTKRFLRRDHKNTIQLFQNLAFRGMIPLHQLSKHHFGTTPHTTHGQTDSGRGFTFAFACINMDQTFIFFHDTLLTMILLYYIRKIPCISTMIVRF